jgi:DNA-binding NtrC family response regulator
MANRQQNGAFAGWHACCEGHKRAMTKKLKDKSVLIVDDDSRMLRALDKVLTGEGAAVTEAQWAGDALDFLTARKTRVDLVITDLRMPLVSGMTAVYAIHKIFPELPIIVLTAFGSPDVKAECLRQGAAAFMEKPLNTAELLDVIEQVFARHAAGDKKTENEVEHLETNQTG